MSQVNDQALDTLRKARKALQKGDTTSSRYWARNAASLAPEIEDAWLLLAALGSPRASLVYLQQALEINPSSQRARQGMHWAVKRYRESYRQNKISRQIIPNVISKTALIRNTTATLPWAIVITLVVIGFLGWFIWPTSSSIASSPDNSISLIEAGILKATITQTPTATPTSTLTPTTIPSPTSTLPPTSTETPPPTETPLPTETQSSPPVVKTRSNVSLPQGVEKGQRWIDVDLTNQRVFAYQGKNQLKTFVVSTGTWQHPTVTGQYRIYVKYLYADMAGPGYYLPNVPYVMYFYKGYGIHGTYWHNNFGTQMSHGCINLKTEDAGWIFNWSSIGTLINIHN